MTTTLPIELARSREPQRILKRYQNDSIEKIAEIAELLCQQDYYRAALLLYQRLLQQQKSSDYYYGLGLCYGKLYNYLEALEHLDWAFALQKERTEGAYYYAYILERNLQMDRAYEWYQKALFCGYDRDLWTLSHYAYFLEKYGQKERAEELYQQILINNSAYTWTLKRYALFLLEQNKPEQSMELMQNALSQFPNNLFVKLNYLEYLIIRGMTTEYENYLNVVNYENSPLPFQILVDLFNYFLHYLLQHKSDTQKLQVYQEKTKRLQKSIHRDFDDLKKILISNKGNLVEWQQVTEILLL
jgi:tetratricopeptide (TPR) repeat protein